MKYTENCGRDAPKGLLSYGLHDSYVMARAKDRQPIYFNDWKRDALTTRKMYQNTGRLLNIRTVLHESWSDEVVDLLKMLVVDLGPYLTVRGKQRPDGVKQTALSSSVLRTLTGYTWDMTVPVQDWEEGQVPFRDRRAAPCLNDEQRAKVAGIWSRKDPEEIRGLPNPIMIEDIPSDLRQIIFQTCEDVRCMKEEYMHGVETSVTMLAIHEHNKSATMERLSARSKKTRSAESKSAFLLSEFGSMDKMVAYVRKHGWGALTQGSPSTPFGKAFLKGPAAANQDRQAVEVKWNSPEFYEWLGSRAQPHGSRCVYKMKEGEDTRLIPQWVGEWPFHKSYYRSTRETESLGVPLGVRALDHNEGAAQPYDSSEYESSDVGRYMSAQSGLRNLGLPSWEYFKNLPGLWDHTWVEKRKQESWTEPGTWEPPPAREVVVGSGSADAPAPQEGGTEAVVQTVSPAVPGEGTQVSGGPAIEGVLTVSRKLESVCTVSQSAGACVMKTTLQVTESFQGVRKEEAIDRDCCTKLLDMWSPARVKAYEDAKDCVQIVEMAASMRARLAPNGVLGYQVGEGVVKATQNLHVRQGTDGPELWQREESTGELVSCKMNPFDLGGLLTSLREETPAPDLVNEWQRMLECLEEKVKARARAAIDLPKDQEEVGVTVYVPRVGEPPWPTWQETQAAEQRNSKDPSPRVQPEAEAEESVAPASHPETENDPVPRLSPPVYQAGAELPAEECADRELRARAAIERMQVPLPSILGLWNPTAPGQEPEYVAVPSIADETAKLEAKSDEFSRPRAWDQLTMLERAPETANGLVKRQFEDNKSQAGKYKWTTLFENDFSLNAVQKYLLATHDRESLRPTDEIEMATPCGPRHSAKLEILYEAAKVQKLFKVEDTGRRGGEVQAWTAIPMAPDQEYLVCYGCQILGPLAVAVCEETLGTRVCRNCDNEWGKSSYQDWEEMKPHYRKECYVTEDRIWSPSHLKDDDLWFRKYAPGSKRRTPGEAKSVDELDWGPPAQGEDFRNDNAKKLSELVAILEQNDGMPRFYGEGVYAQGKLRFFRLRLAGPECGRVLPNGESERLGELNSVAKDVWYRIREQAEVDWTQRESSCRTWGYKSALEMAMRFVQAKPYVVYGGKAARVLRTTNLLSKRQNEPTHVVSQAVMDGTDMSNALTCGLKDCRIAIGANGATVFGCDSKTPNVDLLKKEIVDAWRVKAKKGGRVLAAELDKALDPIPESDTSHALVYPALDQKGSQRDLVTGPRDGAASCVDDVLVVNPGGHEDRLLGEEPGRLTVPFMNWTNSPVWTQQSMAAKRKSSKRWTRDRVPFRQIRHLGRAWTGQGDEALKNLIEAFRMGLADAGTRYETDSMIMGQIEINCRIETVLLVVKDNTGRYDAHVTVACGCGRAFQFELPAIMIVDRYNESSKMQIVLTVGPNNIMVDPGGLTIRMMLIAENARSDAGESLMEIFYGTALSWREPVGSSHLFGCTHQNHLNKRCRTYWTCGKTGSSGRSLRCIHWGTEHQLGSLASGPIVQREGAALPTKSGMLLNCGSAVVLAHVVCEKIVEDRIRYKNTSYGRKPFYVPHHHIQSTEPVAILYTMDSTSGLDKMYEGMDGRGVVISLDELPYNDQDYMCHVHPGVNHIGNEGLPQRMFKEMAAYGTVRTKGRSNWAPFGLKSGFRRPLGDSEEDFAKYIRSLPNRQHSGRSCEWTSTLTDDGHLYMPSRECWDFVRDYPPAMPAGAATDKSPISGMGWYLGIGIGIDRGYLNDQGIAAGGELDYYVVCQEQGSNPSDKTGELEAWHVKGLENRLSREKTMKSVAKAERAEGVRSDWTDQHGDDQLWARTYPSVADLELAHRYRVLVAQHFGAYGTGDTAETVADSEVTENDLLSLFLDDDDEAWSAVPGAPGSSSGDSGAVDDGPPAGGCDDFC